jgi:hypothetical protein
MRAFSGSAWKTHVLDGASKIAEIRNCSESRRWRCPQYIQLLRRRPRL